MTTSMILAPNAMTLWRRRNFCEYASSQGAPERSFAARCRW
jgi:hypothetical protein